MPLSNSFDKSEKTLVPLDFLGWLDAAGFPVDRNLVLEDLFDHDFKVAPPVTVDERTGPIDQFAKTTLDQGGELESTTKLVDDFIAVEGIDHGCLRVR